MGEPALSGVVDRAIGGAPVVPEDPAQAELLDLGLRPVPAETPRPRGRPPGAVNKRTERIAEYLLAKYPDPLEGLLRMGSLGIAEMGAALGCSPMEAFQEKRLCLIAALPFIHKRQPIAVDLNSQSVVHLAIHTGRDEGEGEDTGLTVLGTVIDAADGLESGVLAGFTKPEDVLKRPFEQVADTTGEQNQALSEAPDAPR